MAQSYAPTCSHDDQLLERFYEDVESVMAKVKTQYIIDFSAKVGKKAGDIAVGNCGVGCRKDMKDVLLELAAE